MEHGRKISVWSSQYTSCDPDGSTTPYRPVENAIETLTSKQRAHLRSLAHPLKPVVHVGKDGLNESAIHAAREALNTRELLKIRVLEAAPLDAGATGRKLVDEIEGAVLVQVIGHVFVIYRPFPEHPEIRIPA